MIYYIQSHYLAQNLEQVIQNVFICKQHFLFSVSVAAHADYRWETKRCVH